MCTEEIAFNYFDIYTTLSALTILYSNGKRKFVNSIIIVLYVIIKDVKIVYVNHGIVKAKG